MTRVFIALIEGEPPLFLDKSEVAPLLRGDLEE